MLKAMLRLLSGVPSPDALSAVEAHAHQGAGALILDVREPDEWKSGHAAGARHVPLGQLSLRMAELPRDKEIIAMCRSGARSAQAVGILRDGGFERVYNLSGGIGAWNAARLPIKR